MMLDLPLLVLPIVVVAVVILIIIMQLIVKYSTFDVDRKKVYQSCPKTRTHFGF